MKFLDINTGYSFDGLWKDDQSKGYIFWFPAEQSIDITYSMPICIITDTDTPLKLRIEENEIFKFITHTNISTCVDGYVFNSPNYELEITTLPEKINDQCFAHLFNISCVSSVEGEFICRININNEGFIRVGADFYGEYEPTYINLSNMGVEIPESVQKTIYDSNVHEDFKDNILLNRKFKELLSNYWDIIANRGSYKSMINALKWFEWDKHLIIKEIWKRDEAGHIMFADEDLLNVIESNMINTFKNSIKTTFVSLYYTLYNETDKYDIEGNPVIENTVLRWSKNDMQLKLSLLSQFFGTFFLPIHMSVFHATVEDEIFTSAIKLISGSRIDEDTSFGDFEYIECNFEDNKVFKLDNVKSQVTEDTLFGIKADKDNYAFGVDKFPKSDFIGDIETYAEQYYSGPGTIIPIHLKINNQNNNDYIHKTIVQYRPTSKLEKDIRLEFGNIIYAKENKFNIKFNFLAKEAINYNIKMTFITASGKMFNKSIKFSVEDIDNLNLNIYKIQAKDDTEGFTYKDFYDRSCNEYLISLQNNIESNKYYYQYLPYMNSDNTLYKDYKGIKLTRTVVVKIRPDYSDFDILLLRGIMYNDYLEFAKYSSENKLSYIIFVSKKFNAKLPERLISKNYEIIRNDLGFYPCFHKLVKSEGIDINNYTISQYEAFCIAPEIYNGEDISRLKYCNDINEFEWTFVNSSDNSIVYHPVSSRSPFVAGNESIINSGYYDIIFKCSLKNGKINEYKLNSAFRIKVI